MAGSSMKRGRGSRGTSSPEYDDEFDEGERGRFVPRRKKTYPLSLLGALLGLLIGVLLVSNAARQSRLQPQALAQKKQEDISNLRENRKKAKEAEYRQLGDAVNALLKRNIDGAELRYDWLVKGMDDQLFSSPQGPKLATAIYKALEARERERNGVRAEGAPEDPGYTRIKTLAQALYDEGKLGDAYNKMALALPDFKHQHGKEIDDFILRVSKEIDDLWAKDKPAIEKYLASSAAGSAITLLEQAQVYGDGFIRDKVDATLSRVREIQLIQKSSRGNARAEEEEDTEEDDDWDDDDWDDDEEEEDDDDWDDEEDTEEDDDDWDDEEEEEDDDDWDDDEEEEDDDDWDD